MIDVGNNLNGGHDFSLCHIAKAKGMYIYIRYSSFYKSDENKLKYFTFTEFCGR